MQQENNYFKLIKGSLMYIKPDERFSNIITSEIVVYIN